MDATALVTEGTTGWSTTADAARISSGAGTAGPAVTLERTGSTRMPVTATRSGHGRCAVEAGPLRATTATRRAGRMDRRELDRLAAAIASDGIAVHEAAVTELLAVARPAGVCPTLIDVLGDAAAPAVARERAFGLVALALTQ